MPEGLKVLSDEHGQYNSSRSILTLEADKRPSERHGNAGNGDRTEFRVNGVTFHYPERITFCIQRSGKRAPYFNMLIRTRSSAG